MIGPWTRRGGWLDGVNVRVGLSARVVNGRWTRMDAPRRSRRGAVMQDDPEVAARVAWAQGEPAPRRR